MLVLGPAVFFIGFTLFMNRSCEHKFEELADYGPVSEFEFTDVTGKNGIQRSLKTKSYL